MDAKHYQTAGTLVYCQRCGTTLLRRVYTRGREAHACYRWFDLAGREAHACPGCGEITSLLSTTEDTCELRRARFVAQLARLPEDVQSSVLSAAELLASLVERLLERPASEASTKVLK